MPKTHRKPEASEMPLYDCHKQVRALKIASVEIVGTDTTTDENEIALITFEDERFGHMRTSLRGKPTPVGGWYYVDYGDYFSFSPATVFEAGYSPAATQPRVSSATASSS